MCHTSLPPSPQAPLQILVSVQRQLGRNQAAQKNINLQQSGWREKLSEKKEEQARIIKGKRMGMILQMDEETFLGNSPLSHAGRKSPLSLCHGSPGRIVVS